ncbi:MAG TPA: hypothetical protein VMC80_03300 [Patescibacteria group bacterium]|nr:hypothetical protein [Patescibacteria group bacterium]
MNKRGAILIFTLLTLFLILGLARAQSDIPLPGGVTTGQLENASNQIQNITSQFGQPNQYWTYLGGEIQKILFGSPVVKGIDSFFHKINLVFVVLFGVDYSFSFSLLLIVGLWFYFFLVIKNILKDFASFSKWISRIIALLTVIIMAQFKVFQKSINLVTFLLFGDKPWWLKVIFWIIIIGVLILLLYLIKTFGKQMAENRKKMKEEVNRVKLEMGAKISEAFGETIGESLEK